MCRAQLNQLLNSKPAIVCSLPTTCSKPSLSSSSSASIVVHHNYHDRCNQETKIDPVEWNRVKSSPTSPFPVKLYELLECVERDGFVDIISWQPHGRCFVITKPHEFAEKLLPRYMKLNKMPSFQRQLNLYGFNRITQGPDKGAYYHEYFLYGHGPLTLQIQRMKVKGTGVRGKSNPDQEPNFYAMKWVGGKSVQQQQQQSCALSNLVQEKMAIRCNISDLLPTVTSRPEPALSTTTSAPFLTNNNKYYHEHPHQSSSMVLEEWGMHFYSLDDVPQQQEIQNYIQYNNNNKNKENEEDDLFETILQSMLEEDSCQQQQPNQEDMDLFEMLERVVSL